MGKDHKIADQLTQRYYRHEPTLLEKSRKSEHEKLSWQETHLKELPLRGDLGDFPELSEIEVVRHFTRLSARNYSLEEGMYPLGSCTMKYNPRINETVAAMPGFRYLHPQQPIHQSQGALQVLYELQRCLCEITGLDDITLQGAAGAHGEFIGLKVINAYHQSKGETRNKVLIPDSAHGTNPASSALCGLKVVPLASTSAGTVSPESVAKAMDGSVAGIMITNPNTIGIFEEEIVKITEIVHSKGGMVYCDGANLNALLCRVNFKKMGVDVMHMNLHKTFSTPHGGGGPGAGPVAVVKTLTPFLPTPYVAKEGDKYCLSSRGSKSIGRVKPFHGSFGVLLRAYTYIMAYGGIGLRAVSDNAVLNANYIREKLRGYYDLPYEHPSLHEVVFTDKKQKEFDVSTMDIAKRMMDYGFHPPTVYFPLIVKGALMIEPTETVTREELDRFVETMIQIAKEAKENPQLLHDAPHVLGVKRFDEVKAARQPVLTWNKHWNEEDAK